MNPNENKEANFCFNCRRNIPLINYVMHTAYCHRNLKLCTKCDEPFLISKFKEHMNNLHTNISCDACFEKVEAIDLESHKLNNCSHRMEVCTFCDIDIKASLLPEHIDMCSSRTERCNDCGKFIMLKSATIHKESHKLKKVPNVAKPILDESPESLLAYPLLTKKVPNIMVDSTVRATTRTVSLPILRQPESIITCHNITSSVKKRNRMMSPPVKRNNDQPQINTLNNNDNINKDPKKNMPIVDIPSDDDDEFSVFGARSLHNNQPVNITNLTKRKTLRYYDGLKDIQLPCEFCEKMIDAENLVFHETECCPNLAKFHISHKTNKNTNSQTVKYPVPPLDLDSSSSSSEINLNTLSLSSDDDDDDDDDDNNVDDDTKEKTNVDKLPCEFCEKLISIKKLINHQIICEKNFLDLPKVNNLDIHDMLQPGRKNTNTQKSINIVQPRHYLFKHTSVPNNLSGRALVLKNSDDNVQSPTSIYKQQMVLPRVKLCKQNSSRVDVSTNNHFGNNSARKNYEQFLSNSRLNHSDLVATHDNSLLYLNPSGGAIPKQKNMKSYNNRRVINDLSKRKDSGSSSD